MKKNADFDLVFLAEQQASRDIEIKQLKNKIMELQKQIQELENIGQLHLEQETLLKKEIRELERNNKIPDVNLDYLKNIALKFFTHPEQTEQLFQVIATILHFSQDEVQLIKQKASNKGILLKMK